MVQVAVSNPTVPNRVTQVVPLAELCSLILATWVIVYCVHMLMVRSQEGPYCNTIIVTSSKTVPLLCLCLEWGKRVYIRSGLKKQLFPTWQFQIRYIRYIRSGLKEKNVSYLAIFRTETPK